jgi:hypothetical protein
MREVGEILFYVQEAYLMPLHWKGGALKIKTFLGPEMATSETHVHKITNVPVFLNGA